MKLMVTGTSTGIGRTLAERLLGKGHDVWGLARSDQSDFVGRHSGAFRASVCDVACWDEVKRASAEATAAWGHLDGLVCCAGLQGEIGRTVAADPERWSATVRANLDGTFHAIRACHPLLLRSRGRAKIVCFSGGGATQARPQFSAYAAAKTAVVRLVETIAREESLAALDINAVAPGAIFTRLTEEVIAMGPAAAGEAEYRAALKLKESAEGPLKQALALVEWLLSPASDGISGRLISAAWDPWPTLERHKDDLGDDIYTLRRIVPGDRGKNWSSK